MKFYVPALMVLFFQSYDGFYDKFFHLGKNDKMKTTTDKDHKDKVVIFESNNRAFNKEIFEDISNSRIILKDYIKIYYLEVESDIFLETLYSKVENAITDNNLNNNGFEIEKYEFTIIKTIFDEIYNLFEKDINSIGIEYREECEEIVSELKEFLTMKFKAKMDKNPISSLVKNKPIGKISIDSDEIKLKLSVYFKTFILNYLKNLFTYFGNFKTFAQEVILKNHSISYYYKTGEFKKLNYIFTCLKYKTLDIDTLSINFLFNCNNMNRLEEIIKVAYAEISNNCNDLMTEKIDFSKNFKNIETKFLTLDKKTFPLTKKTIKMYKMLDMVLILDLESIFLEFFGKTYEIIHLIGNRKIFHFKKPFQSLENTDLSKFNCFKQQEKKQIFKIFNKTILKTIREVYFKTVRISINVFIDKSDSFLSIYSKDFYYSNAGSNYSDSQKQIVRFLLSNNFFNGEFLRLTKEYLNFSNKSNIFVYELET
ncbi:hypothetical protein CWI36_0534p0010 [Hamiltosporidium magnivora]|uniref:Uncharacterized protein n=1 Tax=Hamiltosporidium magnivora TaxID=148818 RepID=A0A4Q9LFU0_9MICR|nr:hypothetical protein CWI36_0534p0010 [Hamiltosporidium magnivora]